MVGVRAGAIARRAAAIVGGERQATHGSAAASLGAVAAVWNGILAAGGAAPARPLDAHDVANLMEGLKIARRYTGAPNVDDYVDGAGYAALAGEIRGAATAPPRTSAAAPPPADTAGRRPAPAGRRSGGAGAARSR